MLDAKEQYEIFCKKHNIFPSLFMLSHMHFETVIKSSGGGTFTESTYNVAVKPKKFLCFNRVPRIHRVMLLAEMYKTDLVKDSFCSFYLNKESWKKHTARQLEVMSQDQINSINEHLNDIPLVLNRTKERGNPVTVVEDDFKYFENSYVSIITETLFYVNGESMGEHGTIPISQGAFISEKIFKPIICKHPFIVLGPPNTLRFMRQFGYRTFPNIINEEYDAEEDNNTRFQMVVDEINRLAAFTDDEWLTFQEEAKEIIDHNFKHLKVDKDLSTSPDYMDYFRK
jgi:hypothetical protein